MTYNFFRLLFISFTSIVSGFGFTQEAQPEGMLGGFLNYQSFSLQSSSDHSLWHTINQGTFKQHPEFGVLPYNAPCENCVEDYSKRTAESRYFIDISDVTKYYQQNSYGYLHYFKNGYWITINPQLQEFNSNEFAAISQLDPVYFSPNNKRTSIETQNTLIHFNRWKLFGVSNNQIQLLAEANWSNYTIGADGMRIIEIFPGIDAELTTARGSVKTNFIVKSNQFSYCSELIFRDEFVANKNTFFEFDNPSIKKGVGTLYLRSGNDYLLEVSPGIMYPKGAASQYTNDLVYQINQSSMDVVVDSEWLNTYLSQFNEVIIDPLVTSTNTLAQASITGSGFNATCFNGFCSYNLTVPTPANSTVTNVLWSFNYRAQNGCVRRDGAISYFLGTCRSPANNTFFWYCNLTTAGDCLGNNISIFNDISSCLPAPSCSPQNLNFTMRFHRCASSGSGCSNTCIGAISPWTMTVEGRTIEYVAATNQITVSNTTICAGQSITASTSTQYGVPPYNFNWSFSPSGSPSVGTGSSTSITFPNPGTITLYSIVTDACGNQVNTSRNITVNAAPVVTANPNPITICSGQATGIGLTSNMSNTSYSWTVVQSGVTGATNGSGTGGGGSTSPLTINQTLTNSGTTPGTATYTITPTASGCPGQPITVVVTVNPLNTVSAPSLSPSLCVNTAISPAITHTTTGATGIGTATGLPAGVTASFASNTITISGTPTATGTFNYTIPLTGGCGTVSATGTITVNPTNTVSAASSSPVICVNTAITAITHTTTGATGIGTATGLPTGVTASFASNTITISGTPTATGTFNYTIPLTGGCGTISATGTITVNPTNTVSAASSSPVVCVNTAIPSITHTTTGATGIGTATGLPAGVTASFASNTITISGTPTATGTFNYTIPLTGGCGSVNATGTMTVISINTVSAPSSSPSLCINTAISPVITHTTTGATGIGTATGLPAGVTASFASNTITISGTPTTTGTFNYTIPLTGGCGSINATGTITVISINTVSATSSSPSLCVNTAISPVITHTTTGATGIGTATGLPAGVTASFAGNTITISGTPTATGTFNYTIPLTGGCGSVNATGTITVISINTVSAPSSSPSLCINTAISPVITHTTTGATGIGTAAGLPAGVTASFAGNTITISGTPTATGTFNYTIPLTGGCGSVNATGTITINPNVTPTFNAVDPFCSGATIPALPTTSTNGIIGSWSPAINNTATTTYTFTPNAGQCATNATMVITITPGATPTFNAVGPFCAGATIPALPTTSTNGITGSWSPAINNAATTTYTFTPNAGQCATNATMVITINQLTPSQTNLTVCANILPLQWNGLNIQAAGQYQVVLTNAAGCDSVANLTLTVNPILSSTTNVQICENEVPYIWNGLQLFTSGTSNVTLTSSNGCDSIATLNLVVNPLPVVSFTAPSISGCAPLTATFVNTSSSTGNCQWNFGNGTTSNNCGTVIATYNAVGCYDVSLQITSNAGCTNSLTANDIVCVQPNPIASFIVTPNVLSQINPISQFINTSTGHTNQIWTFGDGSNSTLNDPTHTFPSEFGQYIVTLIVSNENGCIDSTSQIVVVENEVIYYVPNSFTPDNNLFNETFKPVFTAGFDIYDYKLLIFNRWGEIIFESNNAEIGWDGTYGDQVVQDGTYIWQIEFKELGVDKRNVIRGHVNVLR